MSTTAPKVRVGVRVFVLATSSENHNNPRFLVGERLNAHGAGTWALPSGHLELGESIEECAARAVVEKTGLVLKNTRYLTATSDIMAADNKNYLTCFMVGERADDAQEPENLEPDKCGGWEWWTWEDLVKCVKEPAQSGGVLEKPSFIPFLNLVN